MPKSRNARKPNKVWKKSNTARAAGPRPIDLDYYYFTYAALHESYGADFHAARLIQSAAALKAALVEIYPGPYPSEVAWDQLFRLLEKLESEMASILRGRSVFYWMHLYRRLAPRGTDDSGSDLDWATISLVRDMVESAIQKYGAFQSDGELGLSNEVDSHTILGGIFDSSLERYVPDLKRRQYLKNKLLDKPATVMLDFSKKDLENIYFVEGLAYRYWQITAKMRALGKGAKLSVAEGSMLRYDNESTPWQLMKSFDERAQRFGQFDNSSLGIWLEPSKSIESAHKTFTFGTNSSNEDVYAIFREVGLNLQVAEGGQNANFLFYLFDASEFCRRHEYLADEFQRRRGFSLRSLAIVFECMSDRLINAPEINVTRAFGPKRATAFSLLNLCRRAYSLKSEQVYQDVVSSCLERIREDSQLNATDGKAQVEAIFDSLTLDTSNRDVIGIWSRGPRFPILKLNNSGYVFDFFGIHRYFHNLFVGVREPRDNRRGYMFEDAFRRALVSEGFAMEVRDFTFKDGTKAEADAVFYVGDTLIVVDCLSVWMPLDFDISRPKTMSHRNEAIRSKLDDALPRGDKLRKNPIGMNFDFSRATELVGLVASPFVEWLWDNSTDLWYQRDVPRVMRANELIDWAVERRTAIKMDC